MARKIEVRFTGGTSRVYVVRDALEAARRDPTVQCLVVRHPDGRSSYTNEARISGPSRVVFSAEGLPDGTHAWVETTAPVQAT